MEMEARVAGRLLNQHPHGSVVGSRSSAAKSSKYVQQVKSA
jgi:hypothetical protein